MKVGTKVTFQTDYIKTGDSFDPEYIETAFGEEGIQEVQENGYTLKKLEARQHEKPKVGIIAGKRRYSLETRFDYIECTPYESCEWRWHPTTGKPEVFYLVATNLNSLLKVKAEDLELFMIEEPIKGLMDE